MVKRIFLSDNFETKPAPKMAPAAAEGSMGIKVTGSILMTAIKIMALINTGIVLAILSVPGRSRSAVYLVNFNNAFAEQKHQNFLSYLNQ